VCSAGGFVGESEIVSMVSYVYMRYVWKISQFGH
jgi:hypothetical protein